MRGFRQGDALSPVMFTAAVEQIFKRMDIETGINIIGVKLSHLRFENNIILFAESEGKLRSLLEDLNEQEKKDGMKSNKKIMCNGTARRQRKGVQMDR